MIPYGKQDINQADIEAVVDVLKSDFLTQGPQVPLFEKTVSCAVFPFWGVFPREYPKNMVAVHSFVRLAVRWLVGSFVGSFVRSLVRSFVRLFVCSLVRSFVRSLVRWFVCLCVRSFVRSLVR